jgi:hypothetical protein
LVPGTARLHFIHPIGTVERMDSTHVHAYLAGAIDADGYITIGRSTRKVGNRYGHTPTYYVAKVGFVETSPIIPDLLKETFGGSTYQHQPKNPSHKRVYSWQVSSKIAGPTLHALMPFLRLKQCQAELTLALIEMMRRHWCEMRATQVPPFRITQKMESERRALWEQVTRLNDPRNRRVHFATSATNGS